MSPSLNEAELQTIIDVVRAVEETDDYITMLERSRIPSDLKGHSFFGEYDVWFYKARMITGAPKVKGATCWRCQVLDQMTFLGLELRMAFPYLIVIDENTIMAMVHMHCYCILHRVTNPIDYITLTGD